MNSSEQDIWVNTRTQTEMIAEGRKSSLRDVVGARAVVDLSRRPAMELSGLPCLLRPDIRRPALQSLRKYPAASEGCKKRVPCVTAPTVKGAYRSPHRPGCQSGNDLMVDTSQR